MKRRNFLKTVLTGLVVSVSNLFGKKSNGPHFEWKDNPNRPIRDLTKGWKDVIDLDASNAGFYPLNVGPRSIDDQELLTKGVANLNIDYRDAIRFLKENDIPVSIDKFREVDGYSLDDDDMIAYSGA
jgi:hypothetical protein